MLSETKSSRSQSKITTTTKLDAGKLGYVNFEKYVKNHKSHKVEHNIVEITSDNRI